jgi:CRP-like cAMP-binding protein
MATLLAALPREEYERLVPHLRRVHLDVRQVVYWPGRAISRVYFPISSVLSLLADMGEGIEVEAGIVGSEGLLGLPVYFGATTTPHSAVAQVAGDAWQMPADAFRQALDLSPALRILVGRYAQAFFVQLAQGAGCSRTHSVEQRCARWLLMVRDRVEAEGFALTQELLAAMIGARRASVSTAMAALQRRGLIEYTRGHVTIRQRIGLEAAACVCYRLVRDEMDRLLGPSASGTPPA